MTTTVTVEAHVQESKQVTVQIFCSSSRSFEETILQDGETATYYVTDDNIVSVCEVEKDCYE